MSFEKYTVFILILAASLWAQKPVAQLPAGIIYSGGTYSGQTIDTTYALPTGGKTWAAHSAAQFSTALASSSPGDVIVLDAGVTYTAANILRSKPNPNNQWIYITSSAYATLPSPGTRVSPADAVNMPKLVTPNVAAVFQLNGGVNYLRLIGLEITTGSNYPKGCGIDPAPHCSSYFLIGSQSNPTPLPDHITIDRCYIHGAPTYDIQSAVQMTASNYAVIDSYVSDVHIKGFDSTGLASYWSPGPFKITNNYISASTENIMFGGSGGNANPYVPSDIQVQFNYLYKPLAWVPLSLAPGNQTSDGLVVKNCFELKSAQRVLFDSNTCQNVWFAGQDGFAEVLTVRASQSGDIAVVNDVTITNNQMQNVTSGFTMIATDDQCGNPPYTNCKNSGSQDRWLITNNTIFHYDPTIQGGFRNLGFGINPGLNRPGGNIPGIPRDIVYQHISQICATTAPCWNSVYFGTPLNSKPPYTNLTSNIWLLDNAMGRQPTGDWGLQGQAALTNYMSIPANPGTAERFYGNEMYLALGDKAQTWMPANSVFGPTPMYQFDPQGQVLSPKWTTTSDGLDAGYNLPLTGGVPQP